MEAEELRLNNWVNHCNKEVQITIHDLFDIAVFEDDVFTPIPLTEEWLLKFGFNKEYQKGYIGIDVCNSDFVLTEPLKMGEWQTNYTFQFETGSVPKFKEIKYVHQLQNIYFALTGEELILKN